MRNFIPKASVCILEPSVPSSPFIFVFLYSLNLGAFNLVIFILFSWSRRGGYKARQNCGQVSRRRRAFRRKAQRSPRWAPERLRLWWPIPAACPLFRLGPRTALCSARASPPRAKTGVLQREGGARTRCATSRRGVPGARHKRQDSLGWGVTFAPWKVRTVGSRRKMSLAGFERGVAGGHPTSSAVDSSARGPASPFHQATLARQ